MRPGEDAPQADHVRFLFDPRTTLTALAGQRRRFASTVAGLRAEELASPSRCAGWTVADVLRHLIWADTTMRTLWSGDVSIGEGFDPRTTPDVSVRADRAIPDEEIRDRYLASAASMADEFETAEPGRWGEASISPLGGVPWWMSAVHLGWDACVHERDVLNPLGRAVDDTTGEALPGLAYTLVMASFFSGGDPLRVQIGAVHVRRDAAAATAWADGGHHHDGADGTNGIGGEDGVSVDDGITVLTGDRTTVTDALCGRGSLDRTLHGDRLVVARLGGLARFFASAR